MTTTLRFSDLRSGMCVRVTSVGPAGNHDHRLVEMGLTPGAEFKVVKVAPLGDPIEIELRGYKLCLRRKEARGFELERIDLI